MATTSRSQAAAPPTVRADQRPRRPGLAVGLPEAALLLVVLLWSSTFIVTKGMYDQTTPLAFAFVRFILMDVLALGVMATKAARQFDPFERSRMWAVRGADIPRFIAVGVAGYTCYQLGFLLGLERTSPFASSLLIAMVPLFTVVILALIGERTPFLAWVGLLVALVGVVIFLLGKRNDSGTILGDALSVGAAISFAVYSVLNRPLVRTYPTETYTAYTILAGSLPLLAISTPAALAQDWTAVTPGGWAAILYMVVLPVYLAYMIWNWAIARRGAALASSFTLLVPIASGILSALIFREEFGPLKLLGAAIVLVGLLLPRLQRAP